MKAGVLISPALTHGGLPVRACDVVPLEAIIVNIVQDGQAVLITLAVIGLRSSQSVCETEC